MIISVVYSKVKTMPAAYPHPVRFDKAGMILYFWRACSALTSSFIPVTPMPHVSRLLVSTVLEGCALSFALALELAASLPSGRRAVYAAAGVACAERAPFTCGIINAKSGRCGEDCSFCAQSAHHDTDSPVYGLVDETTLLERARVLAEHGVDRMGIVTSGGGPSDKELDAICAAAGRILGEVDIKLCASLGMLREGQAERLVRAGFTSYHHNLETARSHYPAVCGTHSYELRVDTVRRAKAAGLRVCSGGLFGLGESWEQRLEFSETLRELDVDSIPVNFLIPIAGTRLERMPVLSPGEALDIVAVLRLMHPGRDIVICGGRSRALGEWDRAVPLAGANGLMVGDYLTAKGNPFERDMELLAILGFGRG